MANEFLVLTGVLCLALALLEAWMLVGLSLNPSGTLARWIRDARDLLKSHLDFLMMSLFLFVFFLLFEHFQGEVPALVILSMCLGAIGNPLLFLVRAANPAWKEAPSPGFRLMMATSCLLTTLGFLGGAWWVGSAAAAVL